MRRPKLLTTLKTYNRSLFLSDLMAGVTVAMVALPLSLAIAIASGAGPEKGLVTAIVAGFLISLFGGSWVQIGGPTGAFIVVVFGIIAQHGYDGLVIATFMAGIILLIAGYFRAGRLISYIPEAVVNGVTSSILVLRTTFFFLGLHGLSPSSYPSDNKDYSLRTGAEWRYFHRGVVYLLPGVRMMAGSGRSPILMRKGREGVSGK